MSFAVKPPQNRDAIKIAVICALTLEASWVQSSMRKIWKKKDIKFGKGPNDENTYTFGVIGSHNVVLAHLPGIGSHDAVRVAIALRSSFTRLAACFVVGICGVIPRHVKTGAEIVLGDPIISAGVIVQSDQADVGSQDQSDPAKQRNPEDILGRASHVIRTFIAALQTNKTIEDLEKRVVSHLKNLEANSHSTKYPGIEKDWLFLSDYPHQHQSFNTECEQCLRLPRFDTCRKSCAELGCNASMLIPRTRLSPKNPQCTPKIHFGRFASANYTLRSGVDRDAIAKEHDVIAFEMEGSGIWDSLPTIVIKSACDYADAHKNKDWQTYAAATAAATLIAVLEKWHNTDDKSAPEATGIHGSAPTQAQELSEDSDSESRFSRIQTYVKHNYNKVGSITGNVTFN